MAALGKAFPVTGPETHYVTCVLLSNLAGAPKQPASKQILLWNSPTEAPKALQASECSELLGHMEANYWIFAQH